MRQNYDKIFLQNILDKYPNMGMLDRFFLYTSGYENSNYYIRTEKGQYVIKVFEGMGINAENILFELKVMDYCNRTGIKTPRVLKNEDGRLETKLNGKYVMIMDFIEGENMDKKIISDELVVEVAEEAGRMDKILRYFKDGLKTRQNYEWDLKNTLILEKALSLLPKKYDRGILEQIFSEFKNIKSEFGQLPSGLIHNDIVPHNWLVTNGKLNGIIDFSDMAFSPYIQNIAVSLHLVAFSYNWNPKQANLFIKNYAKLNPLSPQELKLLYILIQARFLSFIIEFNRWNVEYKIDRQRTEAVDDNYKFLERFIELGSKKFNQLIKK